MNDARFSTAAVGSLIVALAAGGCRRHDVDAIADDASSNSPAPTSHDCPVGSVRIPGGTFSMGVAKTITAVDDVCIDVTEVTVAAYGACVAKGACTEPERNGDDQPSPVLFQSSCNWKHPSDRSQHPVNCVTWDQAVAYCESVGRRLPSAAEWEWAARGGTKGSAYPWGEAAPDGTNANACGKECAKGPTTPYSTDGEPLYPADDGFPETAPVGSFPKGDNPWGVHDLAGNVWEWTSTTGKWHWTEAAERSILGTPAIMRGGAFNLCHASMLGAAYTSREELEWKSSVLGFRCARTP